MKKIEEEINKNKEDTEDLIEKTNKIKNSLQK